MKGDRSTALARGGGLRSTRRETPPGGSRSCRGNRRVPRPAKQDQRQSEAEPEGLAEQRRETRRGQKRRPLEAVGSRSREGRPQGCRSRGTRQGAAPAPAPGSRRLVEPWRQTAGLPELRSETRRGSRSPGAPGGRGGTTVKK